MKNYLMRRYKELSKKERKGFTLVELLVVIAILAVLASVSVVGYLGFTQKARNSNALTELTQARELIRAELIDGETNYYSITTASNTTTATEVTKDGYTSVSSGFTIQYSGTGSDKALEYSVKGTLSTWDAVLKAAFSDLADLKGTLYVVTADNTAQGATTDLISTVSYVTEAGGIAKWTVASDVIAQGEGAKVEDNNIAAHTA